MRRYTATVALWLSAVAASSMAGATSPDGSVDSLATKCMETRGDAFVKQARERRAQVRIEVEIVDDDCGQTVQMVLWKAPDGTVASEGLLADQGSVRRELGELQRAHPEWRERTVCDALSLRRSEATASDVEKLGQLAGELEEMVLHPVIEPVLIIHGLQYKIRVESGISESTFFFHAPGYPRPAAEELHPLDRWSQELRHALGLRCDGARSSGEAGNGSSENHEERWI